MQTEIFENEQAMLLSRTLREEMVGDRWNNTWSYLTWVEFRS